jgi:ubiquinone/menaquinone biosynthesis C-methylase UbiE
MAEENKMPFEIFNMAAAKYEALSAGSTRELARYMMDSSQPIDAKSTVLDNACGTGVVAQEVLLRTFGAGTTPPKITCTDAAPAMVDMARDMCRGIVSTNAAKISADEQIVTAEIMPGEDLRLPDDHFTHSFTNQGFQFFKDAVKGAAEIYRTLKPGGTAVVTTWTALGHVRVVQEAQKAYKPDAQLFRFPLSDDWLHASHLERTLRDGGFQDVEVHEKTVWYATKTLNEMNELLFAMFKNFPVGWSEEETAKFRQYLEDGIKGAAVKVERAVPRDVTGATEELLGFPLVALVAVAKK